MLKKKFGIFSIYSGLLVFLFLYNLQAQILNFRNFGADEGLVQSQVFTILQDNDGYLWFGTVNGISKYDGHKFVTITRKDGLAENHIISGLKDRNGNLWFGHNVTVISKFNWHTQSFERIYLSPKGEATQSKNIQCFFEDKEGRIWIATYGSGVFYIEDDSLVNFNRQVGLPKSKIYAIGQDDQQNIWFGTDSSLIIYSEKTHSLKKFNIDSSIVDLRYTAILNDGHGNMWVGTMNYGLYKYNLKTKKYKFFQVNQGLSGNNITSLFVDKKEQIWVGDQYSGASYAQIDTLKAETFTPLTMDNGLPFNGVNTVMQDREGNYWFGTSGRGAAELRDRRFELWVPGKGEDEKSVWSMYIDSKGLKWFGTGEGIFSINKKGKTVYKEFQGEKLNDILQITEDSKHNIWFTSDRLSCLILNKRSGQIKPFSLPKQLNNYLITSVAEDKAGNIIMGGLALGLVKYNIFTKRTYVFEVNEKELPSKSVNILYRDSHHNIWVGMRNTGLLKWDGKSLTPISGAPKTIVSVAEGPRHDLWLLNDKDRLFRYANNSVKEFDLAAHGLDGLALFSVNADNKSVWLGTSSGLARLGYDDSLFTFYTKQAGYPVSETNENAVYKDKEGNLWFGSIDGAICFHPGQEKINPVPPLVHIQKVKHFFKEIPLKSNARFDPSDNYFSFSYIGISLSAPEAVRYRYRLVGLDKEWLPETELTNATYSNLPPGSYSFQVKARNGDGVWNTTPARYDFTILTPFWQTWWFVLLIMLIVIFAIYLYISWRTKTIKRINRILEDKVQNRTKELQDEKNALEKAIIALKESEHKFKTYTNLTSSAIYIHQGNTFKFVNKAGEKISGYSRDELMQMNIWDLVHPDYKKIMQERFQARINGEKAPNRYEFKILTKDRRERWLDFTGQMINFEDQPALLATVFDITERKKAEEELLAEKERLMVTLRSIGDGVITTDIKGKITLMNDRAKEILDCSDECKTGVNLNKVLYIFEEQTGAKKNDMLNPVFKGKINTVDESNLILNSMENRQKYISLAVSSLKDSNDNLLGVVLVIRDDTEKRQMQQELIKGQKLESVGVLAGGIAHDFNNILTAIIGNLSLAKLQLDTAHPSYVRIENAEKASARAQDLTQQLLTFSKGGAPVKQIASIEEIIRDSVAFILSGSNVKARLSFSKHIPTVEVDAGQISQVVQNLIINADQAMPGGGNIDIDVSTKEITRNETIPVTPGNYVIIKIKDEGIGIAKEHLDKIFDPFFTTKQSGSGLGLATSYSILQKHGGLITVESELGKGTTFRLYLPAAKGAVNNEGEEHFNIDSFKGKGRILVMDDEILIHETISEMLNRLGYEIEISNDGYEMLEKYKQAIKDGHPFVAVFMDLTIPGGMGGKVAVQELLKIDPEATAIVSSGYSSDPVMAEYERFGFKACLRKPYRLEEIISVLQDLDIVSN